MASRDTRNEKYEEFDNYWNSGINGNQEDYEKYLLIKSRLEGRSYRSLRGRGRGRNNSLLSFHPGLTLAFWAVLLADATRIVSAYVQWGAGNRFYTSAACWAFAFLATYWYFARRDARNGTLFLIDRFALPVPRSLPYWMLLLGLLPAVIDLNDLKAWAVGIETLALHLGYPVDCSAFLSLSLPHTPPWLKSVGEILASIGGGLLIFDSIVALAAGE